MLGRLFKRGTARTLSSTEARNVVVMQDADAFEQMFTMVGLSKSDVNVTRARALGVPAYWAAVNFLAGTVAGLPLHVYRKTSDGRERVAGGVAPVLHDAWNDETSSFAGRKYTMEQVLTGGRGLIFIERNAQRRIVNLWPLEPDRTVVSRENGRRLYRYTRSDQSKVTYDASEIIDIPWMLQRDGVSHYSPVTTLKDVLGLAIASTDYASRYFQNGGVPPFAVTGPFQSGAAMQRAADDLEQAVRSAATERRQALTLPTGLDIKPIGANPEEGQLIEARRFAIEEIARVFSLPPTFLQDLTHGTYSNTEQNDLHFVKHTLRRWLEQIEQEMNLKLFGRGSKTYVEFSVDGLLRGDFKTRMEGHAAAIQTGQRTPNEAREMENRPKLPGGDVLLVQGAMIPLTQAGQSGAAPAAGDQTEGAEQ